MKRAQLYSPRNHRIFLAVCTIGCGTPAFSGFRHLIFEQQGGHPLLLWFWMIELSICWAGGLAGGEMLWRINKFIDTQPGRWDPFTGLLRRDKDGRLLDETEDKDKKKAIGSSGS